MKTLIISLMVWGLPFMAGHYSAPLSAQTVKKIVVGSHIPDFKLPDQNGKMFDIKSVLGKKNLVIYFYPKDGSTGCTREACNFRDKLGVFKKLDAEVIGISGDGVVSHKQFADKNRLEFTLLSDQKNKIRSLFGVPTSMLNTVPGRVTYIVNKKGIVTHITNSLTKPDKHIQEAITALIKLKK
jgi:thioredoxin-dependent peroxiredoxin